MIKANEISKAALLERDVKILFDELRRLRAENEKLKEENRILVNGNKEAYEQETEAEKEELGYYIAQQRAARFMSVNEFARLVEITAVTLRRYEKGIGHIENMKAAADRIRLLRGRR